MKLVDEIVEMASDSKRPLGDALRKCLVLAFELKNANLKEWVEKELNGFDGDEEAPDYRRVNLHSKGHFSGPLGASIRNRPIPTMMLEDDHLQYLNTKLVQPIGAYEKLASAGPGDNLRIPWPPDLTTLYQSKLIKGYGLVSAWQEVPMSLVVGLCEEVRNRLLRFALEIREELGQVGDKASEVPAAKVEAAVVNHIYGGTNVIAGTASDFTQMGSVNVIAGDTNSLATALKSLGFTDVETGELKATLAVEGTIGQKTAKWIKEKSVKVGGPAGKIATGVVQAVVTKWAMQYLGLDV